MSNMATKESQPKEKESPSIVTKHSPDEKSKELRQARTPKHANTKSEDKYPTQDHSSRQQYGTGGYPYPPRDYRYDQQHQRQGGPPFSPGQQQQQQQYYQRRDHHMATVSPGTNEYRQYYGSSSRDEYQRRYPGQGSHPQASHPGQGSGRYDARYGGGDRSYDQQYGGGQYPPQQGYPQQYRGSGGGGEQYPPDSRYGYGRPSYPHRDYGRGQTPADGGRYGTGGQPFTRAVSSSFDRSVNKENNKAKEVIPAPEPAADASEAPSDDNSWGQLNQVASIDEGEMQKRLAAQKSEEKGRNIHVNQEPGSTSSSLTNSPHDPDAPKQATVKLVDKAPLPTPSKLAGLDSLSSVASGQEPMETKKGETGPPSPGSSAGSLDLMKCHSGSSGLLHGFPTSHSRGMSTGSLDYSKLETKRSREERGDANTDGKDSGELRRAPSVMSTDEKEPPAKKSRKDSITSTEEAGVKTKGKSPLGIDCSPPMSPSGQRKRSSSQHQGRGRPDYTASPGPSTYFDKAPSYTYSLESNPSFERGRFSHQAGGRPASASSSTITPMERNAEHVQPEGVGPSLPSWDLQPQDSFGNGSAGGGPLVSSFSFSQDYPMLASSGSNLGYNAAESRRDPMGLHAPRHPHAPPHHPSAAESRNQSFDGGHYHGGFDRSNSMDQGYPGNPPRQGAPPLHPAYAPHDTYKKHTGSFPPQAPSWGTTTSAGSHAHGPHYRGPPTHYSKFNPRSGPPGPHSPRHSYGMMNRNYSEDSNTRTSPPPPFIPPPAPPRSGFQPPPEFAAPHNPHLSRRPPPAVYIMSSSGAQNDPNAAKARPGSGIYSWTKDDDVRLTEVMKKYKNPRDWEPIAKEHGRAKSAKECHERWIRYLKPGVRKGQWQDHEDAIVVEAVTTSTEQPFTRWSDLAQRLPGRVGKQIRDRWVNHLNPNINHLPFSREDDLLLWEGHKKLGKRWVEISTKNFNSSRSENHIKNRWYSASFKKFIANEFGPDAYSGGKTTTKKKGKIKQKDCKTEQVEAV